VPLLVAGEAEDGGGALFVSHARPSVCGLSERVVRKNLATEDTENSENSFQFSAKANCFAENWEPLHRSSLLLHRFLRALRG
jgi:hypothetical protein